MDPLNGEIRTTTLVTDDTVEHRAPNMTCPYPMSLSVHVETASRDQMRPDRCISVRTRLRGCGTSALAFLVIAGCSSTVDPSPTPRPSVATLVTRASTPGELNPPHPADNPYEHTDVIVSLRHDFIVAAWGWLNDLCSTDEYKALVDVGVFKCEENYSSASGGDRLGIGPASFTPLEFAPRDDDHVEVIACYQDSPQSYALRSTGEVETEGSTQRFRITYDLSPLTEDERTALITLGLEPTTHRLREVQPSSEPCPDVEVTTQIFVDWLRTSVFTSPAPYSTPPPHWRDDTSPTRPPSLAAR